MTNEKAIGSDKYVGSTDLISRSSLLAKYDKEHEGPPGRARKLIEEEPQVHTEIIYCKGCGHRDDHGCCKYWKGLSMGEIPIATDDYDFCSHARRREVSIDQEKMIVQSLSSLYPLQEFEEKAIQTILDALPTAQQNLSEEYAKAVRNWLVNYQIKCAKLKGRYTPYEVLGWIVSDWRKENGIW